MEIVKLNANTRPDTGKKGAKLCRKKGLLPGIFYGKDDTPTPIAVDPRALDKALHTHAGGNVIIALDMDREGKEPVNVVVKELQLDTLRGTMRHVDFCHISLDKKIRSMVPIEVVGDCPGVKAGGILERIMWELEIESMPLDIPDLINADVSALNIGDTLTVSELALPENITVLSEPDATVIAVSAPRVEEVVEAAEEAEVEGAEPEVIGAKTDKEGKESEKKEGPAATEKGKKAEA